MAPFKHIERFFFLYKIHSFVCNFIKIVSNCIVSNKTISPTCLTNFHVHEEKKTDASVIKSHFDIIRHEFLQTHQIAHN